MLDASHLAWLSNSQWAQHEFADAPLPDQRLNSRLIEIARDFASTPGASIPRACRSWARSKAAYRFFAHDRLTVPMLLAAHLKSTLERMRSQPVVLAVQDTTVLDYAKHFQAEGLGPINQRRQSTGMLLHGTLAFTPERLPLGVLQAHLWTRERQHHGDNRQRNKKPLSDKESKRWLQSFEVACQLAGQLEHTQVVSVADREGDLYEVLAAALRPGAGAAVLIRAQHDRRVVAGRARQLWDHMRAHEPMRVQIDVPRHGATPPRRAACEVRFGPVVLSAPLLKEEQPALEGLWFVEVRETGRQKSPILWRLVTTLPVRTLAQALEKVHWYMVRWQIEVFHRTLKTGCGAEKLQLDSAHKLQLAVAIKMVVAWRVLALLHASRAHPQAPAHTMLTPEEIAVVVALSRRKLDASTLTLRQATHAIAVRGGFMGRRADGEPGALTLWHGWQELKAITHVLLALHKCG
jgi:hypothetical protein